MELMDNEPAYRARELIEYLDDEFDIEEALPFAVGFLVEQMRALSQVFCQRVFVVVAGLGARYICMMNLANVSYRQIVARTAWWYWQDPRTGPRSGNFLCRESAITALPLCCSKPGISV